MPKVGQVTSIKPFWESKEKKATLYQGHVLDVLSRLSDKSVQTVTTSPPYWGLREYGTNPVTWPDGWVGSYGNEPTPQMYVDHTMLICQSIKKVLRDDGVFWLNLGDTYVGGGGGNYTKGTRNNNPQNVTNVRNRAKFLKEINLLSGNLVGIPWRVALALQEDGWILRQDIIWRKKSVMPESVNNRCTKSHEYIFMLTKKMDYFCDMVAIKEPSADPVESARKYKKKFGGPKNETLRSGGNGAVVGERTFDGSRNKRDVWTVDDHQALAQYLAENHPDILDTYLFSSGNIPDVWDIATTSYRGAHYAVFPPKLIEPCILAGTSAKGACPKCHTPWSRVVMKIKLKRERPNDYVKRTGAAGTGNSCSNSVAGVEVNTLGWKPGCICEGLRIISDPPKPSQKIGDADSEAFQSLLLKWYDFWERMKPRYDVLKTIPCVVLDPFCGSGTTCMVAGQHGRESIGIDLSEKYLRENAIPRILGK